jgi:hypothetical protein
MGPYFRKAADGLPAIDLDPDDASVLRTLIIQFLELIGTGDQPRPVVDDPLARALGLGIPIRKPEDPVLLRLFPDGYGDDPAAAEEFRRFTEPELRESKRDNAMTVLADLSAPGRRIVLDPERARAWLGALNDLRLALGTRLEVDEDVEDRLAHLSAKDPRRPLLLAYLWLGYLVETLLGSME